MRAEARYVGAAPGAFAMIDRPAGAPSGLAVVICGPFGWEGTAAYRPLRDWAQALASEGHLTLRLALPGTGDSPGGPDDAGLFASWQRAVVDAVGAVRAEASVDRVAVIGVGFGGVLALLAKRSGAPIDQLALWATPATGGRILRELRAFAAFEDVHSDNDIDGLAVAGYRISSQAVDAISAVDLTVWPEGSLADVPVLVLGRRDGDGPGSLGDALSQAGAAVTSAPGGEFTAMTVDAGAAKFPGEAIASVSRWLAASRPVGNGQPHEPVATRGEATLIVDGVTVHESGRWHPLADGRELFAVACEPEGADSESMIVLLNAGAVNRTGPNRMWVEIARRWAGRGVPSVRIDMTGVGDSAGDASALGDDGELHTEDRIGQVELLLDALKAERGIKRFVLIGLCSGAYVAIHVAARRDDIGSVVALNPRVLTSFDQVLRRRAAQRASHAFSLRGWRDLVRFRGKALKDIATILRGLLDRAIDMFRHGRRSISDESEQLFDQISAHGTRLAFVFSGSEPLEQELDADGRWEQLDRWPTFTVERLTDAPDTHTLRPPALQAWAHTNVDRELTEALGARAGT